MADPNELGATRIKKTFDQVTGITLPNTSQLRLFNLMLDEDRLTKFVNLYKSLNINSNELNDVSIFDTYHVEGEGSAWWDNIAYEVYGTPLLWWVVALFNDVTNPFEELDPGQNLYILKPTQLFQLFKDIEIVSEL